MKLIPPTPERVRPARESLHWRESLARIVQEGLTVLHSQLAAPLRAVEAAEGERLYRAGQGLQEETGLPGQPAPERPPGAGRPLFRRVQAWWGRVKAWCRAAVGLSAARTDLETWTQSVDSRLDRLEHDVAGLKQDMAAVKRDVAGLKQDMAVVKSDVAGLKSDMAVVKSDVADMRSEVKGPQFEKRVRDDIDAWFRTWALAQAGAAWPARTTFVISDRHSRADQRAFLDDYCAGATPDQEQENPSRADAVVRITLSEQRRLFVVAEISLRLDRGDLRRVRARSAWLRTHLDPPAPVIPCLIGLAVWEGLPPLLAAARMPCVRTASGNAEDWQAAADFDRHARYWLHLGRPAGDDPA